MSLVIFIFLLFGAIQVGAIPLTDWNFMDFATAALLAHASFQAAKEIKEL